ncbi:MAG: DNA polymerase III subunit delta, partial [Pseudomonadota bacterium]
MKLAAGKIEGFLRRPDPNLATVLLYGPDQGLVGERARRLLAVTIEDPADPFLITDLDGETLRQQPGRLVEEAQALSLMGGRRAVRLRHAPEVAVKALNQLLELEQQEAFVLIEAGDLGPATPLRKLIERARNAMAIPCYREEGRGLAGSIKALLDQEGLRLEPDAMAYLNDHLGADHGVTRREVEKL